MCLAYSISYESIKNNSLKTPSDSPIHLKKGLGIRAHNKRGNGYTLSPQVQLDWALMRKE